MRTRLENLALINEYVVDYCDTLTLDEDALTVKRCDLDAGDLDAGFFMIGEDALIKHIRTFCASEAKREANRKYKAPYFWGSVNLSEIELISPPSDSEGVINDDAIWLVKCY